MYQSIGKSKVYLLWDGVTAYPQPTHEGAGATVFLIPKKVLTAPAVFNFQAMNGLATNPGVPDPASAVLMQNTPEPDDFTGILPAGNLTATVDTSNPAPAGGFATYGAGSLPAFTDAPLAGEGVAISCLDPYINIVPAGGDTADVIAILIVDHLRRWQS